MALQFYQHIKAGEYIFHEGENAECAFIIESGRVQITIKKDGEDVTVAVLEPGELFGEMAIIDGLPRSASAFAMEDCHLSVISKDILNQRVHSSEPIIRMLISILIKRIRNTNRAFKGLSSNVEDKVQKAENDKEAHDRIKLERDLFKGLHNNEFILEYQPVLNLKSRDLIGFEALLRWDSKERGRVPPNMFIDVAEESSLILPLGEWILNQSMKDLVYLQGHLQNPDLFMSVNVSVHQLTDLTFEKKITDALQLSGVTPAQIKLEVTERLFQEGAAIFSVLNKIKKLGLSFTMDDFGTGYSSLNSLFELDFETIKVDRTFVCKLMEDKKSKAIVKAIIALAAELNLNIVAEGIEQESEAKLLSKMGCQMGQGFLFAKSLPLNQIISLYGTLKKSA